MLGSHYLKSTVMFVNVKYDLAPLFLEMLLKFDNLSALRDFPQTLQLM